MGSFVCTLAPSHKASQGTEPGHTPFCAEELSPISILQISTLLEVNLQHVETDHLLMSPNDPDTPRVAPGGVAVQDIVQHIRAGSKVQVGIREEITSVADDVEMPLIRVVAAFDLDARMASLVVRIANLRTGGPDEIGADGVDVVLSYGEVEPIGCTIGPTSIGTVRAGQHWV
jgi:hypothetical protein